MAYEYDPQNIFARILRGEIPCSKVLETEHSLAFRDINPQAPTHVLVIPKGPYVNYDHFAAEASEAEIVDFVRAVGQVARELGCAQAAGGNGYRILSNAGPDAHQEVPHLHVHLFAGRFLGRMIRVPD
ncbi:histidine triad nucleotide-binding protein [Oceanicella actignis]|uniref:Histidine triad (HIT) family protein n=1 Tax=Oceanicella actignis TaxID=1189325 RepID=A0A1M7TYH4_9RHOB|nr:histidine triad nucleotide-binding protein [Oceanicella actignis]TYO89678.1 histidine triad (HIT) family protein [Oceanicella actignis]SET81957.1 histidine triad (HIT) family protein [Oceanicella actignis]SHN75779.1 histidine triad (HIT) family protein [Oceanicella actignis]